MKYITSLIIFTLSLLISAISADNSSDVQDLTTLEITLLQQKVDLMKQKVELLKQSKAALTSEEMDTYKYNENTLDQMWKISYQQVTQYYEQFKTSVAGSLKKTSHSFGNLISDLKLITEKQLLSFNSQVNAFDFIQTKSLRYPNHKYNINSLYIVALSTGEIIIRNPAGDELIKLQSGFTDIIDVASPSTLDDPFFAIVNRDGKFKIYNFTIIESSSSYMKYQRENFGVRLRKGQSMPEEELKDTEFGQKMIDQGFPLSFQKPFIFIDEEEEYDVKDIIRNNLETGQKFNSQETFFKDMQVYQVRTTKYFVLVESTGFVTVLYRNMKYKTRFYTESPDIKFITKNNVNLLIAKNNTVGFLRIFESKVAPHYCDAGTSVIKRTVSDYFQQNIIYGLTTDNHIIIFDSKLSASKQDQIECKIIGKLQLSNENFLIQDLQLSILAVKGGLLLQDNHGHIFYLNTTDFAATLQNPQIGLYVPKFVKVHAEHNLEIPASMMDMKEIKNIHSVTQQGNLVLVRMPGEEQNRLLLLDYQPPNTVVSGSLFDSSSVKVPLIALVIIIFIGFMLWNRQSSYRQAGKPFFGAGNTRNAFGKKAPLKSAFKRK